MNNVHFISPYAADKNIGKAYNEACELIPDGDWICITDQDSFFLLPDSKRQVIEIAQTTQYELLGCMTNRLNPQICANQLHNGEISNETDILSHYDIAKGLQGLYSNKTKPTISPIAGMLMLFEKQTWKSKKFSENSIYFDQEFSHGLSKGIMQGVYVFHFYRLNKDYLNHEHLINKI